MFESAADNSSILSIDLGLLIGLLVLRRLLDPLLTRDRILFGVTTGSLLIMYALWRWHDTLPTFAVSVQNLWQYFFFAFEALAIVYTLMSIVILFRSIDRSGQADDAQKRMEREGDFPAVDIFICTYDEPLEILERSILTALALDYPDATVWVLDDTRRGWLREYCMKAGARYITRGDNRDAKAGNLNNGLAVTAAQTNAPVILVLDADFAPRRDFLKRVAGLLSNPDVAVVQTPQFYCNPDPIQHNLLAAQSWVDDQRFFFDIFQPAKDAWGCAFCVGTSFIVRRDRLNEIGGFPSQAISEARILPSTPGETICAMVVDAHHNAPISAKPNAVRPGRSGCDGCIPPTSPSREATAVEGERRRQPHPAPDAQSAGPHNASNPLRNP